MVTSHKEKAELLHRAFEVKQPAGSVPLPDICHPEPLHIKFAFDSRDVKKILDNLDTWGGKDPNGFFPLFFKKVFSVLSPKISRFYRFLGLYRLSEYPVREMLVVPLQTCTKENRTSSVTGVVKGVSFWSEGLFMHHRLFTFSETTQLKHLLSFILPTGM